MQETEKILERLAEKIKIIDDQLKTVDKSINTRYLTQDFESKNIHELEQNLDDKLKALKQREQELDHLNSQIDRQKKELELESKQIQTQCKWYDNQMKSLFCRGLIFEIIYKIEKDSIDKEEKTLNQAREISVQTYKKIEKNLKNFEKLKNNFMSEAREVIEYQKKHAEILRRLDGKRSSSEKFVALSNRNRNLTPCSTRPSENKDLNQFKETVEYLRKKLRKL